MTEGEKLEVRSIPYDECKEWCLYKHYAHRIPPISFAFGLYRGGQIEGICSYGRPMSTTLQNGALGGQFADRIYELNRLCVNEGLPANTLSWFVAQTLKSLPKPMAIVSYADSGQHHHGYIYQATNWIYTGMSAKFTDVMVKGLENMHHTSIEDMVGRCDKAKTKLDKRKLLKEKFGEDNVYLVERTQKHRYFYFIGSKTQIRQMKALLAYKQQPYPKGDNIRYDASYQVKQQGLLF